jgi:hypothetical protein
VAEASQAKGRRFEPGLALQHIERLRLVRAGPFLFHVSVGRIGRGDSAGLDEPQKAHVFLPWAHPVRVATQRCLRARVSERLLLMAQSTSAIDQHSRTV